MPNVSLCVQENEVHYNPYVKPNNIITYEASAKLAETTSNKSSGLHTNAFNTTIVSHTFENGVGTIEFNDDVTIIGEFAFYQTYDLTSVTIPDSVTSIDRYAFMACTRLTSINIPSGVTSIGQAAFDNCSKLTSINIPSGVTSIGTSAFGSCDSLTSVTIPNSVTSIGGAAFASCSGLTSVTIGNGVTNIDYRAFQNCSGLTSITIEATTPPTLSDNDVFANNASGRKIYVPAASVEAYKTRSGWSDYAADIEAIP